MENGGSAIVASQNDNDFLSLRVGRSGTGTITVTGTGSMFTAQGYAVIGRAGSGTLVVENGGTFLATLPAVGSGGIGIGAGSSTSATYVGGSGVATITSDGMLDSQSDLYVGINGVNGTLDVNDGGTVLAGTQVVVGSATQVGGTIYGGSGTLDIGAGGTVELTLAPQTSSYAVSVGSANSSVSGPTGAASGTVIVSGSGALLNTNGNGMAIGLLSNGTMTVSQGGTVVIGTPDDAVLASLSVGRAGTGTLTVTGAGSMVTAQGYAYFGRAGSATLVVENSGTFLDTLPATGTGGIGIGQGSSSNVTYVGGSGVATITSGGVLDDQSNLDVGINGVNGTLDVNDAGIVQVGSEVVVGSATQVGGTIYGGSGTLDIGAGGTVELTLAPQDVDYGVYVGSANSDVSGPTDAASGTLIVSGSGALLNTNGNGLSIGPLSNGSMTVSQGGTVITGTPDDAEINALAIGKQGTGSLTVTDAESSFIANGGIYVGRAGTGTLTVENSATVEALLDGQGNGDIGIGGAGLTNGNTLYSGGSGTALVTSGGDLFSETGIVVGKNGTSGTLTIQDGGTVEATQTFAIGSTLTVPAGGYDITTTGTTTLSVATAFAGSGTVTVGAGGLLLADGSGISSAPDIVVGAGAAPPARWRSAAPARW